MFTCTFVVFFRQVLDDSLDDDPLDSFYYVKWDDSIYDQFDDFGQVLTQVVLQKVPSEDDPKVRNHGEGPY